MNRCEHGEKIIKFCVTEHCHHKEAAGCQYCMKRYHFHLANTQQLSEGHIEDIIKKLTLPTDSKYKTRILQEASIQYLKNVKNAFNNWIDQAQNAITDRLSHPVMRRQGLLPTYSRLKYRQYRKINAKDLRALNQFAKKASPQQLKKDEVTGYFQQVQWTRDILNAAQAIANSLAQLPQVKQGDGSISVPSKAKAKEVLESIGRQITRKRGLNNTAPQTSSSTETETNRFKESSLMRRRQGNNSVEQKSIRNPSIVRQAQKQEQKKESEALQVFGNILLGGGEEKKKRKLQRRRSSIDEHIEPKFGGDVNKNKKQMQERQERKKKEIQNAQNRKAEDEDRIIGANLLKLGKVDSKKEQNNNDRNSMQKSGSSKDEDSTQKMSQGMELITGLINNVLPSIPQPPAVKKSQEPIGQVTYNIPVKRQLTEEIQSPIWKKKAKVETTGGFGINLIGVSTKDQVIEKPKIEEKKVVDSNGKKDDEVIVLGLKQKNSLLLFSQSLKCESRKAIQLLIAALKYSPNNLSAAEYLSYLYLEGGKAKECLEVCESILLKIEDTPEEFQMTLHLHNNRAAALNMLGRYSESIMVLQKCLRSRRKHYFYKNLADAYFCLGIPQKASMNYQKAVKLDPQYDQAYYNLAVCQFMQQQYTSALINIGQAIRIDNQNESYLQMQLQINKRKANIVI